MKLLFPFKFLILSLCCLLVLVSCQNNFQENRHFSKVKGASKVEHHDVIIPLPRFSISKSFSSPDSKLNEEERKAEILKIHEMFHNVMREAKRHRQLDRKYLSDKEKANFLYTKEYYKIYVSGLDFEFFTNPKDEVIAILISSGFNVEYKEVYFFDNGIRFHLFQKGASKSFGMLANVSVKWKYNYQKSYFKEGSLLERLISVEDHTVKPSNYEFNREFHGLQKETKSIKSKADYYLQFANYLMKNEKIGCKKRYAEYNCETKAYQLFLEEERLRELAKQEPVIPGVEIEVEVVERPPKVYPKGRSFFKHQLVQSLNQEKFDELKLDRTFNYKRSLKLQIDADGNPEIEQQEFSYLSDIELHNEFSKLLDEHFIVLAERMRDWIPASYKCTPIESELFIDISLEHGTYGSFIMSVNVRDVYNKLLR